MEWAIRAYRFDRHSAASDKMTKKARQAEKAGEANKIRCRNCHEAITDKREGVNQNGDHIHHATNPSGCSFDFACYQQAPGCTEVGASSFEHSWFRAYSWQITICAACGEHLGWLFSGEGRFYGLIIDRLLFDDQFSP